MFVIKENITKRPAYPLKAVMSFRNNQKAQWAMFEKYNGWSKVTLKFLDIKFPDSKLVMISGIVVSPSEDKTNEFFYHKDIVHFEYRE